MTYQKDLRVRKRFKGKETILMLLLQTDPEFHELCEDYETCMQAMDYWASQKTVGAQEKAKEYRAIATDLEADIAMKLASFKP